MARPLHGVYYYVTSRGNERQAIFKDDDDRERFLELLGRAIEEYHLRLHGYILMSNHYHLLLETPKSDLNRALRYLTGVYKQSFIVATGGSAICLLSYYKYPDNGSEA